MKIFKFRQVDSRSGISVAIETSREGPTFPSLLGMNIIFDFNHFFYAEVDDTEEENPENYIFEITQEELSTDIESKVRQYLEIYRTDAYKEEIELRKQVFGKYHDTATSSGIYKYEEAKKFLADGTKSAIIEAEALIRDTTETEISQRIVDNHEAFRVKEAKISGLRGKIIDRLDAYVFDETDALGSWNELVKRMEVIGQRKEEELIINPVIEQDLDVKVGYYQPALSLRWEYINK